MNNAQKFIYLLAFVFLAACKREVVNVSATAVKSNSIFEEAAAKKKPIGVVYVEVNSNNLLNTGCYTLTNSGRQLFDVAVIFAGNINYDKPHKRAVVYNNENVSKVLTGNTQYIKPLQQKGIKVLLCILGNHQGAGISNFTSRAAAHDFAQQLTDTVAFYHLDGIDFDDEYADYGVNNTPQPNDSSFVMLLSELRSLMPSKIISFYYYGPASGRLTWNGVRAGDLLDYSCNANYGTYEPPVVPGLGESRLAAAAVWINNTSASTAKTLAKKTKTDGYGVYLYYDLTATDSKNYFSGISTALYADSTSLYSGCLQSWSAASR